MSAGSTIECLRCKKSNLPGLTRCVSCGEALSNSRTDSSNLETMALDEDAARAIAAAFQAITWGPFRLIEKVGQGSFGEVYRAFDTTLEREVALKLLLPRYGSEDEDATAVLREARLLARVRHPNVVPVYGVDTFDKRVGFWSAFVRGRTLSSLLAAQGRFGATETALIGIDLCKAVSAVHAAGLLHRDIKAGNVMREEGGRILLMDFGLSLEHTATHSLSGTPPYMAPELFTGAPSSVVSDIYSLGVLLYQLLTGKYPVEGSNFRVVYAAHQAGKRRSLYDERTDLPEALVRAVHTATAPDPANRFQSAGQMITALSDSVGVAGVSSVEAPIPPSPRKWVMGTAGAAGAAVAAGLALIAWFSFGGHSAVSVGGRNSHTDFIKGQNLLDHYYKPHNMDQAVGLFRKTIDEDPRFPLAWASLCRAYYLQFHDSNAPSLVQSAQDACTKALALDRDLASPHVTLGMLYTETSQTDLAGHELKVSLALDSKNAETYAALADLYTRQGRTQDIEPTLQKAIDLAPMDYRWPNQMGRYYLTLGKLPEAERQFRQAAELTPDNARVWNNVGLVNRRQGKLVEAEAAYRKAIALDPAFIYMSNLGLVLQQEGNYAGAAELYQKSVELNPTYYLAHANLASAQDRMGEKTKARESYLKAILLAEEIRQNNPKDATILSMLGSYYATVQMPDKSLPLLRQAVALAPEDPQVLFHTAEGYELMHNRDEALRWIGRALSQKYSMEALKRDPEMAGLIADPRFATISNASK
jgi:serine/threonine protein kinase/tetratricopeptide (TPR) repeat protein